MRSGNKLVRDVMLKIQHPYPDETVTASNGKILQNNGFNSDILVSYRFCSIYETLMVTPIVFFIFSLVFVRIPLSGGRAPSPGSWDGVVSLKHGRRASA